MWGWAFSAPERRLEQHRVVWRFMIDSVPEHEWVWLTDGRACAALWIPPGKPDLRPEDEERFQSLLDDLLGDGAERVPT